MKLFGSSKEAVTQGSRFANPLSLVFFFDLSLRPLSIIRAQCFGHLSIQFRHSIWKVCACVEYDHVHIPESQSIVT